MANLKIDNGGGITECGSNDAVDQQECDNFDDRRRTDGGKYCFRFRDFGNGFWVCNRRKGERREKDRRS